MKLFPKCYNEYQSFYSFLTTCSYYNSCFFLKKRNYRNDSGIRMHDVDLEYSLMKEKK